MEVLYYVDDPKASMANVQIAKTVHDIVKNYASSFGMVISKRLPSSRTSNNHCPSLSMISRGWTMLHTNIWDWR